ncbi:MAG TPA: hypoxanthine phosphoribosyltransferase [Firmicutes bacterium]|nr:hypoxanthine phosphoribosyltransferase [Bacillota bacterium]
MDNRLKVILTREQIEEKVRQLGKMISHDYRGEKPVLVSVLRGSVYFAVDLSRCLEIPFELDFIGISRYGDKTDRLGIVRITKDLDINIAGKHVIVIEDIVDTGLSLNYLLRNLKTRNPLSLKVCTFLNIEARRIAQVPIAYSGFDLPDIFVVGYGLDYMEEFRNLRHIAEFKK